jgi:uncharacterized protein YfdQ (DUF2303 family)
MFDKEAITALQEGESIRQANDAIAASSLSRDLVSLPSDYTVHDLEPFLPLRRRARGTMETSVLESFVDYTKEHREAGATVFVHPDSFSATAVLNLGTPDNPGHADNRAKLTLRRLAAYSALRNIANGSGHKQSVIAEFLEDWPDLITCFNDDGGITGPKAIAAIRKVTIESLRKLESNEQQLSASKSTFENIQATSTDPLPTMIYFSCAPYLGIEQRTFVLRLGILTGNDKPTISLRIIKLEEHEEEMARELSLKISALFGSDMPIVLGAYSKSN